MRTPEHHGMYLWLPEILPLRGNTLWLAERLTIVDSAHRRFVLPLVAPGNDSIRSTDQFTMGLIENDRGPLEYVPMPRGLRGWPKLPRAAVDARGVAHVVWGAADSLNASRMDHARSLWYARFDGNRWSTPQLIASGHDFFWDVANSSRLVARGNRLHFAASMMGGTILYGTAVDGQWTTHPVPFPRELAIMGYSTIAELSSGRVVLVAQGLAADSPRRHDAVSGLYAIATDDGGVTWSTPVPISSLASEPAYDARLLPETGDGALRLLWYQMTDAAGKPTPRISLGGSPGRVRLAESRDGGRSWRQLAPSEPLRFADGLQVQALSDSSFLVVLADRAHEQILLMTWANGWRHVGYIDAKPEPMHPAIGRDDAQRLVLSWGTIRGPVKWFLSMSTTLTPCD